MTPTLVTPVTVTPVTVTHRIPKPFVNKNTLLTVKIFAYSDTFVSHSTRKEVEMEAELKKYLQDHQ